jgi:PKD repeat protein
MMKPMRGRKLAFKSAALAIFIILAPLLSGCTSLVGEDIPKPSADLEAWPTSIQQGDMVTFDARSSDTMEGVITNFNWDFGDGKNIETLVGLTSHKYEDWGIYDAKVTVENDRGGTDSETVQISVNGVPELILQIPEQVKAGDIAVLDASSSFDPEGNELDFSWDLDWSQDSDGDGDAKNDEDSTSSHVEIPTSNSREIFGSITISDDNGGVSTTSWTIEVLSRQFLVEWTERTFEYEWNGSLEEGEVWSQSHFPGQEGLLISVFGVLELDRDLIEPQDNFTLMVNVPQASWSESAQTTSSTNFTDNESARAELERGQLNPIRNDSEITSDTEEALLALLLNSSTNGFGQGEWIWSISADQADPDAFMDIGPDPDTGNDWTLTVSFVVMVPTLTEIAQ